LNVRIEPKKINRLASTVETVTFRAAEFFALYVEREDEEFGGTFWDWVSDHATLDAAYSRATSLGDATPAVRAA